MRPSSARLSCLAASASVLLAQQPAQQPLRLPALFGDHMVLPQACAVPLHGTAAPGAGVAVRVPWLDRALEAVCGTDGRFAVELRTPAAGGPFDVEIACGGDKRVLRDVLIGDVWLGSGQSNMEMPVGNFGSWRTGVRDFEREAAAADLPQLRLFTVSQRIAFAPAADVEGHWEVCTPKSVLGFSATAFFFGRELQRQRRQPLGLVVSCWGGTVCEAWTDARALADFPEFAPALAEIAAIAADRRPVAELWAQWWTAVVARAPLRDGRRPEQRDYDDSDWTEVAMPHVWSKAGLARFDGVGWYRTPVAVPAAWAGQDLIVSLGPIDDMDRVWFDGEPIGGMETPGHWQEARRYRVPGARVRAGTSELCVCVVDTGGEGGFTADAETMRVFPAAGEAGGVGLARSWRFRRGDELGALPPSPRAQDEPNQPSVLWNGMIAPLLPFPFRGVLWYQGESNRLRAEQYARLFPAMIRAWRRASGSDASGSELPFCFVQIAPYGYDDDRGEAFALRRAQMRALELPAVAMAVTTDIGEPGDIHPRDKQDVGLRLAQLALRTAYGERAAGADAPAPERAAAEAGALRVTFAHAEGGLHTRGDGPHHFEVAGADGVFRPARATIDGGAVVLRCDAVPAPLAMRYCFAAAAVADLWNGRDLPPPPFELRALR
jgi:sialate O-acetylesterase